MVFEGLSFDEKIKILQKIADTSFKDAGFKYEPYLCNGCHDLMQQAISFNDVAIIYVKGSGYRIHFWYMSKDDAISIMSNSNLIDNKCVLHFFSLYYKKPVSATMMKKLIIKKKQRYDTK